MIHFKDDDKAEKWAESVYGEYISLLSEEQKSEITWYTKSESINRELRKGYLSESNKNTVRILDEVINNAPVLDEDIILYRGVDMNFFTDNNCKIGVLKKDKTVDKFRYMLSKRWLNNKNIFDRGFLSTSLTLGCCMNCYVRLKLLVPKGTKMLFINSLSISAQLEMLIVRGHTIHTLSGTIEKVSFRNIPDYNYILQSAEIV